MPLKVEQITHEALALSEGARAQLAQALLQSLEDAGPEEEVASAWETEIAQRLEKVRKGTAVGRPAEEVFRDLDNQPR